jgi:hypothetical protein
VAKDEKALASLTRCLLADEKLLIDELKHMDEVLVLQAANVNGVVLAAHKDNEPQSHHRTELIVPSTKKAT